VSGQAKPVGIIAVVASFAFVGAPSAVELPFVEPPSYEECVALRKELRDQAHELGEQSWDAYLTGARIFRLPDAEPYYEEARNLRDQADELRDAADSLRCEKRFPSARTHIEPPATDPDDGFREIVLRHASDVLRGGKGDQDGYLAAIRSRFNSFSSTLRSLQAAVSALPPTAKLKAILSLVDKMHNRATKGMGRTGYLSRQLFDLATDEVVANHGQAIADLQAATRAFDSPPPPETPPSPNVPAPNGIDCDALLDEIHEVYPEAVAGGWGSDHPAFVRWHELAEQYDQCE
jgi:hypothetical protein